MVKKNKRRSAAHAIFNHKCATCREGDMFSTSSFAFNKPFEMNKACPHCSANLEPEPGFYFGAMFIAYGILVWPLLGLTALFHWGLGWSLVTAFLVNLVIIGFLYAYIFRLSRAIYLNMMVKYQPEKGIPEV